MWREAAATAVPDQRCGLVEPNRQQWNVYDFQSRAPVLTARTRKSKLGAVASEMKAPHRMRTIHTPGQKLGVPDQKTKLHEIVATTVGVRKH